MFAASRPLWFGHGEQESLFYPFGIRREGYLIPARRVGALERWTELHPHLPLTLATLGFPPVIALWNPTWSASGQLTAQNLALALALLVALALAGGWIVNRAALSPLLRGCATPDRRPTRAEQHMSSGRVSQSFANRNAAPLALRWSCLAIGFGVMLLGLHADDVWLTLAGMLPLACFALDAVRDSCRRIHLWLLFDAAAFEGSDR